MYHSEWDESDGRINLDLKHELNEARAEIARHHKDFEKIREILDEFEMPNVGSYFGYEHKLHYQIKRIRNIVG